ncbi:NUDIX hydrolase [Pseudoramibacter sp.]|uniref:NUDIX hydrolase n=1 Tax=Pseudoramibacter sp. TaxID=2034862 RepID=UPI0025F630DA|nr:CoA pyrophosphatase [Pseudoramibacter sp.]MCH4072727.1 CoA pyrophosphatase [Pseudoramibacter sp.]MCH4106498.1 CoA pyrophosphatase [Pseudoramibacter sp.]
MKQKEIIHCMKQNWADRTPGYLSRLKDKSKAVLIPLVQTDQGLEVVYEIRAASIAQPGEVSFPGGGIEKGETAKEAAVRETSEELLISQENIEVIAPMDGENAPTGAPLWPFIGQLTNYQNTFSKDEVQKIFTVPLKWLLANEPEMYMTTLVTQPDPGFPYELIPHGEKYAFREKKHPIYFYQYKPSSNQDEIVIWGVTAQITWSWIQGLKKIMKAS